MEILNRVVLVLVLSAAFYFIGLSNTTAHAQAPMLFQPAGNVLIGAGEGEHEGKIIFATQIRCLNGGGVVDDFKLVIDRYPRSVDEFRTDPAAAMFVISMANKFCLYKYNKQPSGGGKANDSAKDKFIMKGAGTHVA